jgi:hypothetical protein
LVAQPLGYGYCRGIDEDGQLLGWGHPYAYSGAGFPVESGSGDQLLYHEGIGDPQIEQLTLTPSTGVVGKAWPFKKGTCPF